MYLFTPKIQVNANWVSTIKFETKLLGFCEVIFLSLFNFKEAFQTSVGKMNYLQTQEHILKNEKLSSDPALLTLCKILQVVNLWITFKVGYHTF